MKVVAEGYCAEVLYLDRHLFYLMTAGALGERKNLILAMAGTARLPLFHLRHGDRLFFSGKPENRVVTSDAVVAEARQMDLVIERHLPGIFGGKGNDVIFLGKEKDRNCQKQ